MGLNINTNLRGRSGFTIVELLIVIVVIGILAAITIVAFNGVQNRANATKAQTNAVNVGKVADAYNADPEQPAGYPANVAALTGYTSGIARIPSGIVVQAAVPDATNGLTTVGYTRSATAACLAYWNFGASPAGVRYVAVGSPTTLTSSATGNTACTP